MHFQIRPLQFETRKCVPPNIASVSKRSNSRLFLTTWNYSCRHMPYWDKSTSNTVLKGEWHGLAVSIEACHSKDRGIESRSFYFLLFGRSINSKNLGQIDGSVVRHARRIEEERPAGVSGFQAYGARERMNWFVVEDD